MLTSALATVAIASGLVQGATGQAKPKVADPKIVSVSMFKNGYAFVTREIALEGDTARIVEVPMASLGTLWFWGDDGYVESVTTVNGIDKKVDDVPVANLSELLRENKGKKLTLAVRTIEGKAESVEGTILSVQADMVFVRTTESDRMIPISSIAGLNAPENGLTLTRKQETQLPNKYYEIKASKRGDKVYMMSLERGLTWAPAYAIELQDDKKLSVIAKATLLNDLGDLNSPRVRLITGFPNIQFRDLLDPLTSGMNQDQWLNTLSSGTGGFGGGGGAAAKRGRAAEMMMQNAYAPGAPAADADWSSVPTAGGQGEQISDLFFYDLKTVSLKKGSRRYQTLFRYDADYKKVFCLDLDDPVINNVEYRAVNVEEKPEVWQALRFPNSSGQPLTTAAGTVFMKGEMVGQGMLNYTSAGADVELRVNKSLDVLPETSEEELSRERGAIKDRYNNPQFDLVTVKGLVSVRNRKREKISLIIKRPFTGEFIEASGIPKVTKTAKGIRDVNPTGLMTWNLEIESGKSLDVTYQYKMYVRSAN